MNVNYIPHSINETLDAFALILKQFIQGGIEGAFKVGKNFSYLQFTWKAAVEFTSLQWTLLKVLSLLLLLTSLLIGYFWKIYGEVITDKFVRPSTLKEIEELKLSVAKLKLPKEHSPRI